MSIDKPEGQLTGSLTKGWNTVKSTNPPPQKTGTYIIRRVSVRWRCISLALPLDLPLLLGSCSSRTAPLFSHHASRGALLLKLFQLSNTQKQSKYKNCMPDNIFSDEQLIHHLIQISIFQTLKYNHPIWHVCIKASCSCTNRMTSWQITVLW